jgi:peptide/nickel transport system permease protein
MTPSHIMVRHALRPSCFSLITVISVTLGRIIGGAVVVEIIFNLPGMGRLIVDSIAIKDYPVVQACVLMIAVLYVVTSAFVDVLYAYLDPRIRRGRV